MYYKGDFVMKYVGSKNRLAKNLVPIIQSYIDKMQEQTNLPEE